MEELIRARKEQKKGERVACIYLFPLPPPSRNIQRSWHRPRAQKLHAQPATYIYCIVDARLYGHIRNYTYSLYLYSYIAGLHKQPTTTPGLALFVQLRLRFFSCTPRNGTSRATRSSLARSCTSACISICIACCFTPSVSSIQYPHPAGWGIPYIYSYINDQTSSAFVSHPLR